MDNNTQDTATLSCSLLHPKLKHSCFPAGFFSTVRYSQISGQLAVFDAQSNRETSLLIRGDHEKGRNDADEKNSTAVCASTISHVLNLI